MRLGMMQPYFFPYAGYFSLIHATESWVVFDTAQYIRRAWVNRNRILSDGAELWSYVRVLVEHAPRETAIADIRVDSKQPWLPQFWGQLDVYRLRRAPYFSPTMDWLQAEMTTSAQISEGRLAPLLVRLLVATCDYIKLPFSYQVFSQMSLTLPTEMSPGDWALHVSKSMQAKSYVNAPGGRSLFDPEAFASSGIELQILEPQLVPYRQGRGPFIAGLSILDLLMWNSPQEVLHLISQYSLESDLARSPKAFPEDHS